MSKNEVATKEPNAVQNAPRNVTDIVGARIAELTAKHELVVPKDYSPENALKSAWLQLQSLKDKNDNLILPKCSKVSIYNALFDMVVQGLSPAKKQCYFIPYAGELQLSRSYMGTVAVAKRFSDVQEVRAHCVYDGDDFAYEIDPETALIKITKHVQNVESLDKPIRLAYAVVVRKHMPNYVEVMTIDEIRKAWGQGATKGSSPAHKNFPQEMAKKTVINRACKLFINTSSDEPILVEAYNRTTQADYRKDDSAGDAGVIADVVDAEITEDATGAVFGDDIKTPFDDDDPAEVVADPQPEEGNEENTDEADKG